MFYNFYSATYHVALIAAAIACFFLFRKAEKPFRLLAILVIVTLCNEFVAYRFGFRKEGNGIVYNIFTPVEYCIYGRIYAVFFGNKKWSSIIYISLALLIITEIVTSHYYYHSFFKLNSIIQNCENVMLIFLSLFLFIKIRGYDYFENLLTEGIFWFNSAVLLYYGYNVIFWSLFDQTKFSAVYELNYIMSSLLYLAYTYSVYLNHRTFIKK